MITLVVGKTADDKRKVNKTVTTAFSVSANIYGDASILAPQFLIDYRAEIFNQNYVYVQAFSRYYFINNVTLSSGARMIVSCSVDPLFSFKNQILALTPTIIRQENAERSFLPDKNMTPTSKKDIDVYKLTNTVFNIRGLNPHSSSNYVLCVAGGHS